MLIVQVSFVSLDNLIAHVDLNVMSRDFTISE